MANPSFQISDTELYSNSLTPLSADALSSNEYSSNYYIWDFGDGNKGIGKTVEHVYETVGDFDVTLTQYLSSGVPVESDPQTVTVRNLIPNLMEWDEDSYSGGVDSDGNDTSNDFIIASVKTNTPFIVNTYNSWQQYDEDTFLHLYVENSKSIPFDITDKRIHLKPNWRFLDVNDNVIETVELSQDEIYAQKINDEIYISTNQTEGSVFVGVSSQAKFFFVDDTPSGIDPTDDEQLPSTIIVTQNLSNVYGDDKFTKEDYLQYPSLVTSVTVNNIIPSRLEITSNGVFDIDGIKFLDTKIPYMIRLVDSIGNYIKTNPIQGVEKYEINIGFSQNINIDSETSFSNNYLNEFTPDLQNLGGYFDSYFIPTTISTDTVTLTATVDLDYTINKVVTRYGVFSDENSNKIYRVSYDALGNSFTSKNAEVIGNIFDGYYSNKFGATIDSLYNSVFVDSDDSRVEIYDTGFNLTDTYDLSSYNTIISGHSSPSKAETTADNYYLIPLYDASKLIMVKNQNLISFDLYDLNIDDIRPNNVEILSDNETLFISFISEGANIINKYNLDTINETLTLSSSISLTDYQSVDMVSTRDGSILYSLEKHENTNASRIRIYNTTDNTIVDTVSVGYFAEFITIDDNQNAWVSASQNVNFVGYDTLYKTDSLGNSNSYNMSFTPQNIFIEHIGGITGDSYGNIWLLDSNNDRVIIFNSLDTTVYEIINITTDTNNSTNRYIAYGDWNGFRWYNKFGFGGNTITYTGLYGESEPFKIVPKGKYNLQKINEDFDTTETLKSYRTTDLMLNYDNLFDNFLGSIYGNNLDDGTYIGKNIYEKIANFVMNHGDIETCSIDALESFCEETGIELENRLDFPRDIKRIVDLFSIKFKKLWGEDYKTGFIEDYRGDELNTLTYEVSADPQVKFIAKEKFNNYYSIITPMLIDELSSYPISSYEQSWGWGLSVPTGGNLEDYYEFYEFNSVDEDRLISIIDWDNPLTDTTIEPISSFSDYMGEDGIVSTILGDKIRSGLGLYL